MINPHIGRRFTNLTTSFLWISLLLTCSNSESIISIAQAKGLLKSVSSPTPGTVSGTSVTTSYTYSALGNVLTVVMPGPNGTNVTFTFGYGTGGTCTKTEGLGEPTTITDPNSNVTHFRYDTQRNVSAVIDALGYETDFF